MLEILDKETQEYVPVERLKLYKYATSSWMCSGFHPFPSILSDDLLIQGEEPSDIGDHLIQSIIGEYLQVVHSDEPYDTSIQGRLVNDTSATTALDFIQNKDSCTSASYWVKEFQSCFDCPAMENVILSAPQLNFSGVSDGDEIIPESVSVVNGEAFPVQIAFKSMPDWVTITTASVFGSDDKPKLVIVEPNQSFTINYTVTAKDLQAGVATGALSFAVVDGGNYPGCVGRDLVFLLSQDVSNSPQFSTEGSIRIVGFTMVAVISCTSIAFAIWVHMRREKNEVKMMQPIFLSAICGGVFVIGLSILSRSLLGWEELSARGHDIACMANAWFLSMGFSLVISALLAKLWRINQVADGAMAFRRTNVSAKRAVAHFSVQFVLNFILMLVWTLVDPMNYEIKVVKEEDWKLYGTCGNMGPAGWTFLGLTVGINFCILLLAVYEAYKARRWGEEYSESAGLGLALFCWLQLLLVAGPVLFLIEEDSVGPRYFLSVSLVFACCMSMLLFIFVPLMMKVRHQRQPTRPSFGNFRMTTSRMGVASDFATGAADDFGVSERSPAAGAEKPTKERSEHCSGDLDLERAPPINKQSESGHKRVDFAGERDTVTESEIK